MYPFPPSSATALLALMLGACAAAPPASEPSFKKHVLSEEFISEGIAVGDVNRDGRIDVIAGAFWFEAPAWRPHEISPPQTFSPTEGYSDAFLNFALDVNLDGWVDVIRIGYPGEAALWFENPAGQEGHWRRHLVHPAVGNESPQLVDVDGDGRLDLLASDEPAGQMAWFRAPRTPHDTTWTRFPLSAPGAPGTNRYDHGLGFGDVDGDGRSDVLIRSGWWQAPPDAQQPGWTFHPAALGDDCAHMYTHDFDGDGDRDVVASSAHNYGIWWYEQEAGQDTTRWTRHLIDDAFSQSHALAFADVDGDGLPDLITGKRVLPHLGKDPGAYEPAVLYWYEFKPDAQQPAWVPHRIDDDSGMGLHLVVEDVSGDGLPDVVVSNKKGVFLFEHVAAERIRRAGSALSRPGPATPRPTACNVPK